MKQILIFFFTLKYLFVFSQNIEIQKVKNCNVKFEIDTTDFSKTNHFKFKIINLESKKIKVPKKFANIRIQAKNVERHIPYLDRFVKTGTSFSDVHCTNCNTKKTQLKPKEATTYIFDIRKLHLVTTRLNKPNTKYRFNLHFDNIDFSYQKKLKCSIQNFESPKLTYMIEK